MITDTKERPILFSAPMVRAILSGKKTQTRRVVQIPKWGIGSIELHDKDGMGQSAIDWPNVCCNSTGCLAEVPCPFGSRGDRLWIREAWSSAEAENGNELIVYQSDMAVADVYQLGNGPKSLNGFLDEPWGERNGRLRFKPSIHMPRWASRITLEVTRVRVERLRSITSADALAEGFSVEERASETDAFHNLWDKLNADRGFGWESNPLVWVISFQRE